MGNRETKLALAFERYLPGSWVEISNDRCDGWYIVNGCYVASESKMEEIRHKVNPVTIFNVLPQPMQYIKNKEKEFNTRLIILSSLTHILIFNYHHISKYNILGNWSGPACKSGELNPLLVDTMYHDYLTGKLNFVEFEWSRDLTPCFDYIKSLCVKESNLFWARCSRMPPKKCIGQFNPCTNKMTIIPGSWVSIEQQKSFQNAEQCNKKISKLLKSGNLDTIEYDKDYRGKKYYITIKEWDGSLVFTYHVCTGTKHSGWKMEKSWFELLDEEKEMGRPITVIYPKLLESAKVEDDEIIKFK